MLAKETRTPDFNLTSNGKISAAFKDFGIFTFNEACDYTAQLPYERNLDKNDPLCVLKDKRGTCGTKHALLMRLAEENKIEHFQLVIGLFKMNGTNTPKVAATLKKFNLEYIPEAHNYLKYEGRIIDYTGHGFAPETYAADLLAEQEIRPEQITDYKVYYQKEFISNWLTEQKQIPYSSEQIWKIREHCIRDLYTR